MRPLVNNSADETRGCLGLLDEVVFGSFFSLRHANHHLLSAIRMDSEAEYATDPRLVHTRESVRAARQFSIERLQRIEDKAKSTVLGVGIAVTVLGSAGTMLGKDGPLASLGIPARVGFAALFSFAVVFLLLSGYLAIRAYSIGSVWIPSLEDAAPMVEEAQEKRIELFYYEQNIRIGTVRNNFMSASFVCLRNGLTLLGVLAVTLLFLAAVHPQIQSPVTPNPPSVMHHHHRGRWR